MFPKPQLITLLLLILFTFFLRIPTFFEPAWYGDEIIRLTVAREWFSGSMLYSQIFDNSPPLLYLIFQLAQSVFWLKVLAFVWATAAVVIFYFFAIKLSKNFKLGQKYVPLATIIFILSTSTPVFEGNIASAEIFILAPVISAMFLVWEVNGKTKIFVSLATGTLFAIATLVRIQAITDLSTALAFLVIFKNLKPAVVTFLSFLAVWFGTFLVFFLLGTWSQFISSVFLGNFDYVNFANEAIFPFDLLILKLSAALFSLAILLRIRKLFTKFEIFLILWLIFSFLGASIGGRGYPHYLLQITPAASFLLAAAARKNFCNLAKIIIFGIIFVIFFILGQFYLPRFFSYYANFFNFFNNFEIYKSWFGERVLQSETIASYILAKTAAEDKIFVLGDAPEIYYLSERAPAGIYIVSYHLNFQKDAKVNTLKDFVKTPPKIVVLFPEGGKVAPEIIPVLTKAYKPVFKIGQGQIWERRF